MSTGHSILRAGFRSSFRVHLLHRVWRRVNRYDAGPLRPNSPFVRHMGIFQEFSKRLRGELQKSPELQKSLKDLKEKAGDLKHRTKETTEHLYKHVDAAREEAGARAKQVSAVVKEKVHEAKEKVSEATSQVKESVGSYRIGDSKQSRKPSEGSDGSTSQMHAETQEAAKSDQSGKESMHVAFFNKFSSGFARVTSSATSLFQRLRDAKLVDLVKEGSKFVVEELTTTPSKRQKRVKYDAPTTAARSDSTAIVPVVRKKSEWEKRWDNAKDKARANPIFKRLLGVKEHPVVTKSHEIAEDLRERWETSDSPVVHKIQDLNESLFGETATAMALKEIRQQDPMFSFPDFLVEVQESTRPVLQAYLKGDLADLQKRCSREVVDRCRAERRAYESQGIFLDNKILHISDVEVKETKLLGNVPIIIVAFQTQQIYCVRNKHGLITQGAKDDIHTVYYAWAMQLVTPEEGEFHPRWQLREMQQLGIQAII